MQIIKSAKKQFKASLIFDKSLDTQCALHLSKNAVISQKINPKSLIKSLQFLAKNLLFSMACIRNK